MNKETVLRRLGGIAPPKTAILVEDQSVDDIIDGVIKKHKECASHYDVIFPMFDADGSWRDVAGRLFDFCKQEIKYSIESVKWQYVSSPSTILKNGYCDCKGYALFCAGVIDAMKRGGEQVEWCYRFASYNLFNSTPGHVFVVINPKTDNIWLDPVLTSFDAHLPRPVWKRDEYVSTCRSTLAGIGYLPGAGPLRGVKLVGIGASAEQQFLDSIKEYSDGVSNAIQTMQATGTLNTICTIVLATASVAIPLIAAALAVIKLASTVVSNEFGPGSEAALLLNDVASNPLTAPVTIVETLFNGRTYQSDQYRAAQFYEFYVVGNAKINALNQVSDAMVAPAMKWFVDRLGVFVSGAEHILGLASSPADYMQYYGVNNYTTMDVNRVNAASNVASANFILNGVAGSWANTPGVYDALIAQTAIAQNETVESAAAQAGYQGVYSTAATSGPEPVDNSPVAPTTFPVLPFLLLGLAGAVILIPSKK